MMENREKMVLYGAAIVVNWIRYDMIYKCTLN